MVGGARTALEVGRLLLSLDPLGDPMGCLLALDSHALASRQGQFLLDLHSSKLPIGRSPSEAKRAFASASGGAGELIMCVFFVFSSWVVGDVVGRGLEERERGGLECKKDRASCTAVNGEIIEVLFRIRFDGKEKIFRCSLCCSLGCSNLSIPLSSRTLTLTDGRTNERVRFSGMRPILMMFRLLQLVFFSVCPDRCSG